MAAEEPPEQQTMLLDDNEVTPIDDARPVIVAMLLESFQVSNPKMFQIHGIYLLAYHLANLLVVQKTGAGKSFLILGAILIMRGIAVVVEPLQTVGEDQARSNRSRAAAAGSEPDLEAFHLDCLDKNTKEFLTKMLMSMTLKDKPRIAIVLYISPQALEEDSHWAPVIRHLFENGLVSLTAVDEIQKVIADGRYFRLEFAKLRKSLWALMKLSPVLVAGLSMTATLTDVSKNKYIDMMDIQFTHLIWDHIERRDLRLSLEVCCGPTKAMKAVVQKHLRVSNRKVVVFTNSSTAAEGPLQNVLVRMIEDDDELDGDVVSLTGGSGNIWKSYVIGALSTPCSSTLKLNLSAAVMTAAGDCGWSSPFVGAVVKHGLPESMDAYYQEAGRAGRVPLERGLLSYEYCVCLSLSSWTYLLARIWKCENETERNIQEASALEVLQFLVLPKKCAHLVLEERYSNPSKRRAAGEEAEKCGSMCWCCHGFHCLPIQRESVVTALETTAFEHGDCTAMTVADSLYLYRDDVWSGAGVPTKRDAELLVLQLVAAKILACSRVERSKEGEKVRKPVVYLKFAKTKGVPHGTRLAARGMLAHKDDALWSGFRGVRTVR